VHFRLKGAILVPYSQIGVVVSDIIKFTYSN